MSIEGGRSWPRIFRIVLLCFDIFAQYKTDMMTRAEFQTCLERLGLSQAEAARLLSVSPRTVRRWAEEPSEIPGPAEQALRAWVRLCRFGLSWRPDSMALWEEEPERIARQIALDRQNAIELDTVLERVKARGGPATPWQVDLKKRRATLGPIGVSFYPLRNGRFLPSFYHRSDSHPDRERDRPLLEDAYACIAKAIAEAGPDWTTSDDGSGEHT